ncbi:MAG: cytochrome d ubiquinol oxidase subunit II [Gammaproteobacteria bacterium]|nr:cytochrome d ubiquinol oxidase subunit II [Gammaproteobacteria bacterium]
MPDLETLQILWWALIGFMFIAFALTDGFDFGVGILLPFAAKTDTERRILINAIAPHWDGNQVWFVLAAGSVFAAWPPVYGTAFSLMYVPLMLILYALFLRPVGFDYRSKIEDSRWRTFWDWGIFVGSFVPAFLFGVAFGNLFLGMPFYFDEFERAFVSGTLLGMLHPFALLSGVLSLSLLVLHGATYASWRTEGIVKQRLSSYAFSASMIAMVSFIGGGVWLMGINGYSEGPGNTVLHGEGLWLNIYDNWHMLALPLTGLIGLVIASRNAGSSPPLAFLGSSVAIIGVMATAGVTLFPFLVPSSTAINDSITIYNGSSSQYTLTVMMWAAAVFMPMIVVYTLWCYRAMWGRITEKHIEQNSHSLY